MADEKVNIPEGVTTSAMDSERRQKEHEQPVADFHAKSEKGKDKYAKFGVANHQQLVELVKSNPIVASQLADAYIAGDDVTSEGLAAAGIIPNPNAPQQDNIVGDLDRTGDVAERIHREGQNESAPPEGEHDS